jgi:hypothetical protein
MHNASSRQLSDRDKQVRIVLYGRGQPARNLPARLEAIAMRGASLLVDGPTVPGDGAHVDLVLGHPTPFLYTSGNVTVAHPTAEGSHVVWILFHEYCRGAPLHMARDLIKALR